MKSKLLILGLSLVLGASCGGNKGNGYQDILRPVRVVKVESLAALNKLYTGVVEAEEYSNLAFKVGGPLVAMNVDAGQQVKKGAVVAAIDPLDYDLQYQAKKAAFVTASSQLERDKKLLAMQAISKQEYEVAQSQYVNAKSDYEAAENNLQSTRLMAPFDGFVEQKYVENYQKVQPGEPVVRLINPYKLIIGFILPETSVGLTRVPMKVTVEFDTYKGMWFDARLKEIVDASPDGGGIPVKLTITDPRFRDNGLKIYPGFSCKVNLQIENHIPDSYMIPLTAVFKDFATNETSVWLYDPHTDTVVRRKVTAEQLVGSDMILVEGGLKGNDVIVVEGVNFITGGQKVNVLGTK